MCNDHQGITVETTMIEGAGGEEQLFDMHLDGWIADYPDPDSYMRNSEMFQRLKRWTAWSSETYETLVEGAAHTTDREKRLGMYREADRIWVSDQVLVAPIIYGFEAIRVYKPWVENARPLPLGYHIFRNLRVNTALRDAS